MNAISKAFCLSLFAVVCILLTNVQASPFYMPPETYSPNWDTPFPYQRNIYSDFSVNPVGTPGSGIPGAVYEGFLDPSLKVSDYVTLTGDAQWYESVPGFTQTGLLGIDNRNGTSTLSGQIIFHIDNTANADNEKHVWTELEQLSSQGPGTKVLDPLGNQFYITYSHSEALEFRHYRTVIQWDHSPNPPWEDVISSFSITPGNYFLMDNIHLATECVPEPAALTLLTVGVISLLAYAWRRRM
jgi:hypothetical protein